MTLAVVNIGQNETKRAKKSADHENRISTIKKAAMVGIGALGAQAAVDHFTNSQTAQKKLGEVLNSPAGQSVSSAFSRAGGWIKKNVLDKAKEHVKNPYVQAGAAVAAGLVLLHHVYKKGKIKGSYESLKEINHQVVSSDDNKCNCKNS